MSTQEQKKWPGIARIGMRAIMIVFVIALLVLATLVLVAELTVA